MTDLQGREINYLRLSVTNKCNLSCRYCSPSNQNLQSNLITPLQISKIVNAVAECGIKRVRFTGGEPLMRQDFAEIVLLCLKIQKVEEFTITTNGILLTDKILSLPLNSINLSINATNKNLYKTLCGDNKIQIVLKNAEKAAQSHKVKINCVLLNETFKQQAQQVIAFGESIGASVRFIELMPMGGGANLQGVKQAQIIAFLTEIYGEAKPINSVGFGPAKYYAFALLKQPVGFISPMTKCFCSNCSRIRVLANGALQPCLAKMQTIDLLTALENGTLNQTVAKAIMQKNGSHDLQHITLKALKEVGG